MDSTQAVMAAVGLNNEEMNLVRTIARRFEKLNDMPVRILEEPDLAGKYLSHPHFARYYMWEILPDTVERIVYLDNDVLPLRPLPPMPEADFAAAAEAGWIRKQVCQLWAVLDGPQQLVNSGVFVATRKTEQLFQRVMDHQNKAGDGELPWLRDEIILNIELQIALKREELTFEMLPTEWNQLTLHADAHAERPCLVHFAGLRKPAWIKSGFIAQIVDYLEHPNG